MHELDDIALLRQYTEQNSEKAFAALVTRHIDKVYSVALRHTGNPHQAEEITQAVFVILARKSSHLSKHVILEGWLYETARLTAVTLLRSEIRRARREQEAHMQTLLKENESDVWTQITPLLDAALAGLNETDRNAVVLRFFYGKSMKEVGAALGANEDAAKKRVNRAVEKLQKFFLKRGIASTTGTLAGAISANSVQAAPVALAKTVTAVAIAKGAAASGSTLTLIKGALKIMAWSKAKTAIVAGVIVLLAAGTVTVTCNRIEQKKNAVQSQVLEIIRTNNWNYLSDDTGLDQIIAIGPKAIPVLSNLLVWREPTTFRPDGKFLAFLPATERRRLQDIRVRRQMHQEAVQIVCELGSVAARPLSSALCGVLDDSNWQVTTYAMRALYWSIPESTNAVAAATNWLADPTHQHIFGIWDAESLWTNLPQTAPLLAECLRNPYLVVEAAQSLGILGTNALAAVPNLVEVCYQGVAEPPLKLKFKVSYNTPDEPKLRNRVVAFDALAKIGEASPEVLAAIDRGLVDTNEVVRFAALRSLAALNQPLAGRLTNTLNTFSARRGSTFREIIDWTGTLGVNGREALPWLSQFVVLDNVRKLPEGGRGNTGDFAEDVEVMRFSAIMAICRIEPEATRQYLPDLIGQIGRQWEEVDLLTESKSLAPDIVSNLEPMLNDTNQLRSAIAAYIVLGLEPKHMHALATLRNCVAHGELNNRLIASKWLWKRTGETNDVLPLCIEGLAAEQSIMGQDAASILDDLGQESRPDVSALKAALWQKDRYVRERAGKTLREIAPEEMPPIH
jgi:RNA polymerase sigma factor (sigma-70 family)